MKILSTPRPDKQNLTLPSTQGRFYPKNRRPSQSGTINDMLLLTENKSLTNPILNLKSLRHLNHFKKNNNMIESNIQQDKRDSTDKAKSRLSRNRKRVIDCGTIGEAKRTGESGEGIEKGKSRTFMISLDCCKKVKPTFPLELIRKFKVYPRYKILQLYALYRSILHYSQRNPSKFLQAFESALNYRKIIIKSQIVRKNLYDQKQMQFKDFLLVYKKMEDLMFIQSIIDYLEIIFEAHIDDRMRHETVYQVLLKRSEHQDALMITNVIFKKLGLERDDTVELGQILELCETDIQFCSIFSKLYHQETV